MGNLTRYKIKQVFNFLDKKLQVEWRKGKEQNGDYWLDGKKIIHVTIPHQHGGGSGDSLSVGVYKKLKNMLLVDDADFDGLYDCPLSGAEYAETIRKLLNTL